MKNVDLNNVLILAKKTFISQSFLPQSPGLVDDNGEHFMCAGACLSYSALCYSGLKDEAFRFKTTITSENCSDNIVNTWLQFDSNSNFIKHAIAANDKYTTQAERLKSVVNMFELLINKNES